MSKLLVSSLLRTYWSGDIIVFRNFVEPLYPMERKGLEEVYIPTPNYRGPDAGRKCLNDALELRFRAAAHINPEPYEWIAYLDADCYVLRNIDHLFDSYSRADMLVFEEEGRSMEDPWFNGYLNPPLKNPPSCRGVCSGGNAYLGRNHWIGRYGINAGTMAVRGKNFHALMDAWSEIYERPGIRHENFRDQTALNRLLLDTQMLVHKFERGEIATPFIANSDFRDFRKAALLHFAGEGQVDKIQLAYALHMMMTYGEVAGVFFDFLES